MAVGAEQIIAPRRGDAFVGPDGVPNSWPQRWIEQITRVYNSDISGILDEIAGLKPTFVTISSTDSPYSASSHECITVDMSTGDVTVVPPTNPEFPFSISRDGALNTLTIQGTVNGDVNPEIAFDGTTATLFWNGTEYRYK
jgi:hypothetical protein